MGDETWHISLPGATSEVKSIRPLGRRTRPDERYEPSAEEAPRFDAPRA